MKKLLFVLTGLFLTVTTASADRSIYTVTDWYLPSFQSSIVIHSDGSATFDEKIIADAGDLPGKHGIYRVLPQFYQMTWYQRIPALVTLLRPISDFDNNPYTYKETKDADSITWQIGDPDIQVMWKNNYRIQYEVEHAVRIFDPKIDEFYWNLSGNFWDIDIDHYEATITLPKGLSKTRVSTEIYSGFIDGEQNLDGVSWQWLDSRTMQVVVERTMEPGDGVTISLSWPKGVITPYTLSFYDLYGYWLPVVMPIATLLICLGLWWIWGRDQNTKTVIAEYEPPTGLDVMELVALNHHGMFKSKSVSATIVSFATRGYLKIGNDDTTEPEIVLHSLVQHPQDLSSSEMIIWKGLFDTTDKVYLSSLRNTFYVVVEEAARNVEQELITKKLMTATGFQLHKLLFIIACFTGIAAFFFVFFATIFAAMMCILSGVILMIFARIMTKYTPEGLHAWRQTKGFLTFIKTAEQHRQVFMEKDGLFDRYLPYAMAFGLTGVWLQKMAIIYGPKKANTMLSHSHWIAGVSHGSLDQFTSQLNSLTRSMTSTMTSRPSSSGSSGGGSSGGGGGGGGGGGW